MWIDLNEQMAAPGGRTGKFFCIHHKSSPSLVLEIASGTGSSDAAVILNELQLPNPLVHQLWFVDPFSHTICNKMNNFCLDIDCKLTLQG